MAGTNVEILNPGYSTLWTRDLPYTPGSGEAASLNPFDPFSARPLVEGEFLEYGGSAGRQVTRGGDNVVTTPGTPDDEGTVPAFLYFMEEGRYDAQATRRVHIITGPYGFELRVKLGDSTGLGINDPVSAWDWDGPAGAWSTARRVLAKRSAGYVLGRVTRLFGTNDFAIYFTPGASA